MAWSSVVGEVLGRGEATRAMRETAVIARDRAGAPIRRNLRRAFGHIGSFSAVLGSAVLGAVAALLLAAGLGAGAGTSPSVSLGMDDAVLAVSVIAAAPLFALTRVLAETLKALDRPLIAVSVENAAVPLAVLGACGVLAWLGAGARVAISALLIAAARGDEMRRLLRATQYLSGPVYAAVGESARARRSLVAAVQPG